MNLEDRNAVVLTLPNGDHYWQANPDKQMRFEQMDDDYLANCLRLVVRRKDELNAAIYSTSNMHIPTVLEDMIDEDHKFIAIIIDEFTRRQETEDE